MSAVDLDIRLRKWQAPSTHGGTSMVVDEGFEAVEFSLTRARAEARILK